MRFQFILSEIGIGLRRNLTMTVSLILVTTVSLLLFGVGVLTQKQVGLMKNYWDDRVQVSIFLCTKDSDKTTCAGGEVTQAQRDQIRAELASPQLAPYVDQVFYESKQEAYTRFKEQYKDSVLSDNLTADQMPESFRVKLKDPKKYAVVSQAFRDLPGVDDVEDQNRVIDKLFALFGGLKWSAWAVAALTLLSSVLLVATTIRLTAFTRRRETAIMRLVGASNLVIQLPFVLESLIAAMAGALAASVILALFARIAIQGWLAEQVKFINSWVGVGDALWVAPWMFLIGMLIAGVSSFLSLRRYLKV
ncbi:MAG: permease-like cell division protein FtsX [Kineosporiaceae bacterium]